MPQDQSWLGDVLVRFAGNHPQLVEFARAADRGRSVTDRTETGHFTASACVVDPGTGMVLMIFSPKFGAWLLPGGHIDRGETPFEASLRELQEECGISPDCVRPRQGDTVAGISIHEIPASPSRGEPEHWHFDLQFLFDLNGLEAINYFVENSEVELAEWQSTAKLEERYPELFHAHFQTR